VALPDGKTYKAIAFTYVKYLLAKCGGLMGEKGIGGRSLRLLRMLYERSRPITTYTVEVKQSELAKELNISRQALNVHLRELRLRGYIRTGRGFIDITEEGLKAIGVLTNPAFVFVKVSPSQRGETYKRISNLPVHEAFRVTGDMDTVIIVEQSKLNEILMELASTEGVIDTKSYVTIQTLK